MSKMQGTRVYDKAPHELAPGEYARFTFDEDAFYAVTPNDILCNLKRHTVTEHADGTITVSPSILATEGRVKSWHGWLHAGVWESV